MLLGGFSGLPRFSQSSPHVVGLFAHSAILQIRDDEQPKGEPRNWIQGALDKKLPQIMGALLIAVSAWIGWVASGRIDDGRGGWILGVAGLLFFVVGFALIGVR